MASGLSDLTQAGSSMEVIKSQSDQKQYRYVELPNGIKALLVYDPAINGGDKGNTATKAPKSDWLEGHLAAGDDDSDGGTAAAAAAVQIGSFSDPMELQGLSHFIEHMIFLGSSKYPDEAEMDSFLARNSGGSNAWTELEYTCFHFDVESSNLKPALDRFAQFFVEPLFHRGSMEREVNAVDSEFTSVLQSDQGRMTQLLCHTARKEHPFSKFGWGNKASLWDIPRAEGVDIHGTLVAYYKRFYGAQNIRLAVFGEEPLDKQEANVRKLFGPIKRAPEDGPTFETAGYPFEGQMFYMLPSVTDGHRIVITWQLPSQTPFYEKKADIYISQLLGHEGKGSLLSALQAKGWATGLEAGVEDDGYSENSSSWLFQVQLDLTDAGMEACVSAENGLVLSPLALVFEYLALINDKGVQQWIWDEMASMAAANFRFAKDPEDIDDWVSELAPAMLKFKPEHILVGSELYSDFDPQHIHSVLAHFSASPDNAFRVDLQTSRFDTAVEVVLQADGAVASEEPWFSFRFVSAPLPGALTAKWREERVTVDSGMTLPRPNTYIPSHFSLVPHGPRSATPPSRIIDEPGLRVWHKTSVDRRPDTKVFVKLTSSHFYSSPSHALLTKVLVNLWKDAVQEDVHEADQAGLDLEVQSREERGILLTVNGFSDKAPMLVERLFDALAALAAPDGGKVAPTTLRMVREGLARHFMNYDLQVDEHAQHLLHNIILEVSYNSTLLTSELAAFEHTAITPFLDELMQDMHLEVLAIGNLLEDDTRSLATSVHRKLRSCTLEAAKRPCQRVLKLLEGITYVHKHPAVNKYEDNSAYVVYFQVGLESPRVRVMTQLVISLIEERAYDQLRTKEQLGYAVDVELVAVNGVLGFTVSVVTKHSPAKVDARVDAFLAAFERNLAQLKKDEIEDYKGNVESDIVKVTPDSALDEEAEQFWSVIDSASYQFDEATRQISELKRITLKDIKPWYAKYVSPGSRDRRKLLIQVVGRAAVAAGESAGADHLALSRHHKVNSREVIIADISLVKATLDSYPRCNATQPQGSSKNGGNGRKLRMRHDAVQ